MSAVNMCLQDSVRNNNLRAAGQNLQALSCGEKFAGHKLQVKFAGHKFCIEFQSLLSFTVDLVRVKSQKMGEACAMYFKKNAPKFFLRKQCSETSRRNKLGVFWEEWKTLGKKKGISSTVPVSS